MTKARLIPDLARPSRPPSVRPWRHRLWSLSSFLRNGAVLAAFCLALRSGIAGSLVLAAFLVGLVLQLVLEATSQGD